MWTTICGVLWNLLYDIKIFNEDDIAKQMLISIPNEEPISSTANEK